MLGRNESFRSSNLPITDDSIILQNFFEKMEFLLLFGMKPKNNGLFRRKEHQTEFFSFFRAVCRSSKSLIDGLRYVNDQDQLKTNIGKGRALLRYSLTRQSLGDLIQSCCTAKDIQKQFYSPSGLLIHPAMQHVTGTKQKTVWTWTSFILEGWKWFRFSPILARPRLILHNWCLKVTNGNFYLFSLCWTVEVPNTIM